MKKLSAVLFAVLLSFGTMTGAAATPKYNKGVKVNSSGSSSSRSAASVKPAAAISETESVPGETLTINLTGVRDISTYSVKSGFDFPVRFSKLGNVAGEYFGFLPISYHTVAGDYSVKISSPELSGGSKSYTIKVTPKKFVEQWLTVDKSVADATINNDEASKEFRAKIWPLKELYDDTKYFDGALIMPISGRVTTQYGMIRYVNGVPNFRHDGVDLANATGTPIKAAQNGKVLWADFVTLTGNTIVIEHGMGLKTWYEHMDKTNVQAGDIVKTGDIIGEVGATGFVTGPHLHFSASINGVYINPYTLIETDLLETIGKDA